MSVKATAPNAYPFEAPDGRAVRHPVFGHLRARWVVNPMRPFLRPALEANAEQVAAKVSEVVDRIVADAGFS